MRRGPEVLVVGSLHLDIVVKAKRLPDLDETFRGSRWDMVCGGKGGNQASWSAKLGARTAMISQVGTDDFGRKLLANLNSSKVDTRGIGTDRKAGSGMSVAIVNNAGEYGAVIVSGANLTMSKRNVLRDMQRLGTPRIVLLQNEIDETINIAVARAAKKLGAMVVLNAAPARKLPAALSTSLDILVVNKVEASMLSGMKVTSRSAAIKAFPKLQGLAKSVIVTLGGSGLVVAEKGALPQPIAALKVKVRSTHGAGDCFVAKLAASLAKGGGLLEAAQKANKTAAAYVSGRAVV